MVKGKKISGLAWIVVVSAPLVGIAISPFASIDPINLPKLSILVPLAISALFVFLKQWRSVTSNMSTVFLSVSILFFLDLLVVLFISGAPLGQQIFGMNGRNTGFLAYLSLLILMLASYITADELVVGKITVGLLSLGTISIVYGFMQHFGVDPVPWSNVNNPISTFLGNPNFSSSFFGICATATVALILKPSNSIKNRILCGVAIILYVYLILGSKSIQGLLVTGGGTLAVILIYIISNPKLARKTILVPYLGLVSPLIVIVVLGTLKIGPLADYLYKVSVRQRGFYWMAALKMMETHPFFGVGLDSFGDSYFKYRSDNAALLSPNTLSNSSHNVFLELGSNGGFPLFIIHLTLIILTFNSIFKYLKRNRSFNWTYAAVVGAWLGYVAQCVISINQLGLAVWGWVLMGAINGIEFNSRIKDQANSSATGLKREAFRDTKSRKVLVQKNNSTLTIIMGLLAGSAITVPAFMADVNFRNALQSRSVETLVSAASAYPIDSVRSLQAVDILAGNNRMVDANALLTTVLTSAPDSYNGWILRYKLSQPSSPEREIAGKKLLELNPRIKLE
jgi:O-antigen ligase